jgi:adenylosuccinate synthase
VSLWVIVGGHFGSEGKGKISAYITQEEEIDICVRCGGPNSGHGFVDSFGSTHILRQVPTGFVRPETRLLIPAGAIVDLAVLNAEIKLLELSPARLGLDRNCMILETRDKDTEIASLLRERLSSTLTGVGAAVARRALRDSSVRLMKDAAREQLWLKEYIVEASAEINTALNKGKRVLIEGTQGTGLSLYHSPFYPKATSRDTTAAGFLSEVGVSPLRVTEIVVVFRTFPIRVAGDQAGPLTNEVTWDDIQAESGYPTPIREYTTVTNKLRRVGRFDYELALQSVRLNQPTRIALNFVDYLSYENSRATHVTQLTDSSLDFICELERRLAVGIRYFGVGPSLNQTFASEIPCRQITASARR